MATACLVPGSPAADVASIPDGPAKTLSIEHPTGEMSCVLTLGEATPAGDCTLTLTGFGEGGAYLDSVCGEGGAAAPAAGQQEGSAEPVTGGEAVRMGAAGNFGEGKVRIFLSGVNNEAQTARIALNGLRTAEMRLQEKVDAAGCAVTLTGIVFAIVWGSIIWFRNEFRRRLAAGTLPEPTPPPGR